MFKYMGLEQQQRGDYIVEEGAPGEANILRPEFGALADADDIIDRVNTGVAEIVVLPSKPSVVTLGAPGSAMAELLRSRGVEKGPSKGEKGPSKVVDLAAARFSRAMRRVVDSMPGSENAG